MPAVQDLRSCPDTPPKVAKRIDMLAKRGRRMKLYNTVKKTFELANLNVRERKEIYGQLIKGRAKGIEPGESIIAFNVDQAKVASEDKSVPSMSTYYWLGICAHDTNLYRSVFRRPVVLVAHYPEDSDRMYRVRVSCFCINGMLIGNCERGEIFQGEVGDVDLDDPFVEARRWKGDEEPNSLSPPGSARTPMNLPQHDCVPFIPTRSEKEYDRSVFLDEMQTKGPLCETLKVLLHCMDQAGETLFFQEMVQEPVEMTVELVTEAISSHISIEEDDMELQVWVLPQMNGVKEVYRWLEGGIAPFMSGEKDELYLQAHLSPQVANKRRAEKGRGKSKKI